MPKRIIGVGVNSAGVSAAVAARKTDVKAGIILISEEKYPRARQKNLLGSLIFRCAAHTLSCREEMGSYD